MVKKLWRFIVGFLRANFIAGLFIAVPFAITVGALVWVWITIQQPLAEVFKIASGPQDTPWARIFSAIRRSRYDDLFVPMVSLVILLAAVLLLGIITRSIIGRIVLLGVENVVSRVPIVGMLYMSLKHLGEAFIMTDGQSRFQRAVAVQFPYKGCWAVGFVTGKAAMFMPEVLTQGETSKSERLTVFVPTTPLPTQGFMLVVPEDETVRLGMSVQDALKLVVSGGMLGPGDSHRTQPESEITRIVKRQTMSKLHLKASDEKGEK
ncbi:MAG: DUF502 domain-containing protein [Planctomycetota bacterium]|nr:DUF502 domain-containing protein [Planctomycetota bacterium]